ncbi:MAG: hypothetical protein AAF415_08435 [Pseudomonadota bacterium]
MNAIFETMEMLDADFDTSEVSDLPASFDLGCFPLGVENERRRL